MRLPRLPRDLRADACVGLAILVLGGTSFLVRGSLLARAAADADARAAALEPRAAEIDRAEGEIAALRSGVVPRAQLETELGELRPLFFQGAPAVLGHVREVCRKFAAPASFDPERDVHALASVELSVAAGPKRSKLPVQVVLTTSWDELAPFLADIRGSRELVLVESASVERGELPLVTVRLTLEALVGEGGAP